MIKPGLTPISSRKCVGSTRPTSWQSKSQPRTQALPSPERGAKPGLSPGLPSEREEPGYDIGQMSHENVAQTKPGIKNPGPAGWESEIRSFQLR